MQGLRGIAQPAGPLIPSSRASPWSLILFPTPGHCLLLLRPQCPFTSFMLIQDLEEQYPFCLSLHPQRNPGMTGTWPAGGKDTEGGVSHQSPHPEAHSLQRPVWGLRAGEWALSLQCQRCPAEGAAPTQQYQPPLPRLHQSHVVVEPARTHADWSWDGLRPVL